LERLNSTDSSGKFAGRLDLGSVGLFGHSFGGATAAQACHEDARCKAGIDMDGNPFGSVIEEGLTQHFIYLLSDHSGEKGQDTHEILGIIPIVLLGPIGERRGLAIAAALVAAFFEVHLRNWPSKLLTNLAKQYPEIDSK
jgi:hypothetical protein